MKSLFVMDPCQYSRQDLPMRYVESCRRGDEVWFVSDDLYLSNGVRMGTYNPFSFAPKHHTFQRVNKNPASGTLMSFGCEKTRRSIWIISFLRIF